MEAQGRLSPVGVVMWDITLWKWRKRRKLKFIGYVPDFVEWTNSWSMTRNKIAYTISLYMSDNGRRYVDFPNVRAGNHTVNINSAPRGIACKQWEKGGAFPDDFVPMEGTLGPMLMRLVDKELGLL